MKRSTPGTSLTDEAPLDAQGKQESLIRHTFFRLADLQVVTRAIDLLAEEYAADHTVVFRSEGTRLTDLFNALREDGKTWLKSRRCMSPNCTGLTVKRSHTIPRAALALLADDGHVLMPSFDIRSMRVQMRRTGLRNSSTFPGFCSEHEQHFQDFERKVGLEGVGAHLAQVFRTVCREIVILDHNLTRLDKWISRARSRVSAWGSQRMNDLLHGCSLGIVRGVEINGVGPIAAAEEELKTRKFDLRRFRQNAMDPFLAAFRTGVVGGMLGQRFLPVRLPVALAGRIGFRYIPKKGLTYQEVDVIVGVIPTQSGSSIFAWAPPGNEVALQLHFNSFLGGADETKGLIRMVEAWMLSGSDHWCIAPTVWGNLTSEERLSVLSAISDVEHGVTDPWPPGALSRILLAAVGVAE
jgi:hypothetical protein